MSMVNHLQIIEGVDLGMQYSIPPEGARLGRSSKNDIVIVDPLLSRHHCRLFFKSDNTLWVTDLGSANQTLVNGKVIQETALNVGDIITLGNTKIKVINNTLKGTAETTAAQQKVPVDLGLGKPAQSPTLPKIPSIFFLFLLACISTVVSVIIFFPQLQKKQNVETTQETGVKQEEEFAGPLSLTYEKVIANTQNIFRFWLTLSTNGIVTVQMDDLANNRHLNKQKKIDPEYLTRLVSSLRDSGFLTLEKVPPGIQKDSYEHYEIYIAIGKKANRCKIVNRIEPPVFQSTRETIESFSKNELGLWAIQYPTEKLIEMAEKAWLQGKKLYQEKTVKLENLYEAIKNFKEADWHLETIEPKPDYYAEMLMLLSDAQTELQNNYEQANFRAYQAIRNNEWEKAAVELRTICEMIPDRSDERHADARKKLLDVEKRQERKK